MPITRPARFALIVSASAMMLAGLNGCGERPIPTVDSRQSSDQASGPSEPGTDLPSGPSTSPSLPGLAPIGSLPKTTSAESTAQVTVGHKTACLNSEGPTGRDPYTVINGVFGAKSEEVPDTNHTPPFKHIQNGYDPVVGNIFVFFMHRDIDKDPAGAGTDRQRNEIKIHNGSPDSLKAKLNMTFVYTWKFKINPGMTVSGAWTHLFQLKSVSGVSDAPVITITGEKTNLGDRLQIRHSTGSGETVIAEGDWAGNRDVWLSVYCRILVSDKGTLSLTVKKPDGTVVLSAEKTGIDLWRAGDFIRPKWGIYRGLADKGNLRPDEETVRFANFAITNGDTPTSDCSAAPTSTSIR